MRTNYYLGVMEYIDNLLKIIWKLHSRLFRAQNNLKNIMNNMYTWAMIPVIYRKDTRDENLLSLIDKDDRFAERFAEIESTAEQLEQILKENYKLFFDLLPEQFYDREDLELLESNCVIISIITNFLINALIYLNYLFQLSSYTRETGNRIGESSSRRSCRT